MKQQLTNAERRKRNLSRKIRLLENGWQEMNEKRYGNDRWFHPRLAVTGLCFAKAWKAYKKSDPFANVADLVDRACRE